MMMVAVLMPITSPREFTSGPPELPGLSAASVWITSPIRRPFCARSERPTALTMPAVTVDSKPSGLPMAMAICPARRFLELPSRAAGSVSLVSARSTAMSVSGSRPSTRAGPLAFLSVRHERSVSAAVVWRIDSADRC